MICNPFWENKNQVGYAVWIPGEDAKWNNNRKEINRLNIFNVHTRYEEQKNGEYIS